MIGNPNDETNFPHEWLLTDTQVARLCKAFANKSSTNIKLSTNRLSKILWISWWTSWSITNIWIAFNEQCDFTMRIVLIPLGLIAAAFSSRCRNT